MYMRVATIMASPIHLAKKEKGHVQHVQGLGLKLLLRVHTCFTSPSPPPFPPSTCTSIASPLVTTSTLTHIFVSFSPSTLDTLWYLNFFPPSSRTAVV